MSPRGVPIAKMQKKMLGLSIKTDYLSDTGWT